MKNKKKQKQFMETSEKKHKNVFTTMLQVTVGGTLTLYNANIARFLTHLYLT